MIHKSLQALSLGSTLASSLNSPPHTSALVLMNGFLCSDGPCSPSPAGLPKFFHVPINSLEGTLLLKCQFKGYFLWKAFLISPTLEQKLLLFCAICHVFPLYRFQHCALISCVLNALPPQAHEGRDFYHLVYHLSPST